MSLACGQPASANMIAAALHDERRDIERQSALIARFLVA
jgi:hypothetical protein